MTASHHTLLKQAALEIEGVTSVDVTIDTSVSHFPTYRVLYRGTALEAHVYSTLNFAAGLRPPKSTLLVAKRRSS